jgi:hypothetical protein
MPHHTPQPERKYITMSVPYDDVLADVRTGKQVTLLCSRSEYTGHSETLLVATLTFQEWCRQGCYAVFLL